jgi:hypothetical protein
VGLESIALGRCEQRVCDNSSSGKPADGTTRSGPASFGIKNR